MVERKANVGLLPPAMSDDVPVSAKLEREFRGQRQNFIGQRSLFGELDNDEKQQRLVRCRVALPVHPQFREFGEPPLSNDLVHGILLRHALSRASNGESVCFTISKDDLTSNCGHRRGDRALDQWYTLNCPSIKCLLRRESRAPRRPPDVANRSNELYIHRSPLESLTPPVRVYEGCARTYLGEIDGANIIKLHRHSGKISYLAYPDFETDPHPSLLRSVKLSLRTREIDCLEYGGSANPPILHRKESFLTPDQPLYAKFARLTQQEEKHGLLDDTSTIGTRDGWQARLAKPIWN